MWPARVRGKSGRHCSDRKLRDDRQWASDHAIAASLQSRATEGVARRCVYRRQLDKAGTYARGFASELFQTPIGLLTLNAQRTLKLTSDL